MMIFCFTKRILVQNLFNFILLQRKLMLLLKLKYTGYFFYILFICFFSNCLTPVSLAGLHYQLKNTAFFSQSGPEEHITIKLTSPCRNTSDSTSPNAISDSWIVSLHLIQEEVSCGGHEWISAWSWLIVIFLPHMPEKLLLHFCIC